MLDLTPILESVNLGIVVLDRDLCVSFWNPWMARATGVAADTLLGRPVLEHFPELDMPKFHRNTRAVLQFGTFAHFSQKLHGHLFRCPLRGPFARTFETMQQNCTLGPIRGADGSLSGLYILVQDVTELAFHEQQLVEMNTHDALTTIPNRRLLDTRLQDECMRARRYDRPLSLIILDIDHFKDVNDTHGHPCGDAVLRGVALRLSQCVRGSDTLARFGGEEFCCLLPETPLEAAAALAERFREGVAARPFETEVGELPVAISLGVAQFAPPESPEQLLARADHALYEAKRSGRNRVCQG